MLMWIHNHRNGGTAPMKRTLLALTLALALALTAAGCRSQEEKEQLKEALDLANGYADDETDYTLSTGTALERQALYDQDGVTITALGVTQISTGDIELELLVQNSGKEDLDLSADAVCVNGWAIESWFSCPVRAGEAAKAPLTLPLEELRAFGFEDLYTLSFHLEGYNDHYERVLDVDAQLTTDAQGQPAQSDFSGFQVVYDSPRLTITCLDLSPYLPDDYYADVRFLLENHSDYSLTISGEEGALFNDGQGEAEFWLYETLPAQARRMVSVPVYASDLANYDLTYESLYALTLTAEILDTDTYETLDTAQLNAVLNRTEAEGELEGGSLSAIQLT